MSDPSNQQRLKGCKGPHKFLVAGRFTAKCRLCDGVVTFENAYWYRLGHDHGYKQAQKEITR